MHEIISCNLIKPYPCPLLAGLLALLLQLGLQFLLYPPLSESKDIFLHYKTSVPISYVLLGSGSQVLNYGFKIPVLDL